MLAAWPNPEDERGAGAGPGGEASNLETVPAFSRGGAKELLPALSFLETQCLPRPARPLAPGRNVTSCNVAIADKPVPGRGTPAREASEGRGASHSPPPPPPIPASVCI